MSGSLRPRPPRLAVVGASGGLGASTFALVLGGRLARTGPVVCVDVDLDRGGLDATAGVEHLPGDRWGEVADRGGLGSAAVLPGRRSCGVLAARAPGLPPGRDGLVLEVLDELADQGCAVVVDAPSGGRVDLSLLGSCDAVVVLVDLRLRGVLDGQALLGRLAGVTAPEQLGVVTTGATPSSSVRQDLARALGCTHLAHLPPDPSVSKAEARGEWPGQGNARLTRVADLVIESLAHPSTWSAA